MNIDAQFVTLLDFRLLSQSMDSLFYYIDFLRTAGHFWVWANGPFLELSSFATLFSDLFFGLLSDIDSFALYGLGTIRTRTCITCSLALRSFVARTFHKLMISIKM